MTATGMGAAAGGTAGAAAALNVDFNNRQLHVKEISLIGTLAKEKVRQQCAGNAQREEKATIKWADAMERVAKGLVDDKNYVKNLDYLQTLLQSAANPNSEGARGGVENYFADLQAAQAMLAPYTGKSIVVNGVVHTSHGSPQTYFSATAEQRSDSFDNYVLGIQPPDPVVPGMAQRDGERIERFSAINGSARPDCLAEEVVLGGAFGNRLATTVGRWLASLDVTLAGKAGASVSGNISARQITEEGMQLPVTASEQLILGRINGLANTTLEGEVREYVANSYFMRNGFTPLEGKCGSGNCFDGVYIKGDTVYINEVKPLNANGSIKLSGKNETTDLPAQMTDAWIKNAVARLENGTAEQKATAAIIQNALANRTLVKLVTGANENGMTLVKVK